MRPIIEGPPEEGAPQKPLLHRLGWFAMLWVCSLVVALAVAYGLRALIL